MEVLLRDDHVRVDVLDIERRGNALEVDELRHAAAAANKTCAVVVDDWARAEATGNFAAGRARSRAIRVERESLAVS